jgi:anion-transporting  ArsA/GET3 family ATPase
MASLLERKLIVVTGKGGAGKSTIAAALGLLGAQRGLRTVVVEVGERSHLAALYGARNEYGVEVELEPGLWTLTLDPDRALIEWMRELGGRLPARALASSSSFQYFAAAAPGAEELVSLVKLHDLAAAADGRHDVVVLDAPASGHALAMLAAPDTFAAIVRSGPLARRAGQVREMLADPRISGYVAVARATEMAVSETIELDQALRERFGRGLDATVVNATVARRFTGAELARLDALADATAAVGPAADAAAARTAAADGEIAPGSDPVGLAAARAARAAAAQARAQRRQIARLRRLRAATGSESSIVNVPYEFVPGIDRAALANIAQRLARCAAFS